MKTLQNNFTTPEQSKRLLELGVPADSADCYRERYIYDDFVGEPAFSHPVFLAQPYNNECIKTKHHEYIPCWSVGRLMGIFDICYQRGLDEECITESWILTQEAEENFSSYIEYLVETFEIQQDYLDFSKLDE